MAILYADFRKVVSTLIDLSLFKVLGNQIMPGSLNMEIKFVCAQCLRNGQVIEPDRNRKYCSAKAQHP